MAIDYEIAGDVLLAAAARLQALEAANTVTVRDEEGCLDLGNPNRSPSPAGDVNWGRSATSVLGEVD